MLLFWRQVAITSKYFMDFIIHTRGCWHVYVAWVMSNEIHVTVDRKFCIFVVFLSPRTSIYYYWNGIQRSIGICRRFHVARTPIQFEFFLVWHFLFNNPLLLWLWCVILPQMINDLKLKPLIKPTERMVFFMLLSEHIDCEIDCVLDIFK